MRVAAYVLPVLFAGVFLFAAVRRVKVYDSFASGAGEALPLVRSLFPYIAAVLILAELFEASGLSLKLQQALAPALAALGIPAQLAPLVLVSELFSEYGADSYIGRCASVVYASGETVFYLSALYFAGQKKGAALPAAIALAANLLAAVSACLLCRL